jgi:hypothetical protein
MNPAKWRHECCGSTPDPLQLAAKPANRLQFESFAAPVHAILGLQQTQIEGAL